MKKHVNLETGEVGDCRAKTPESCKWAQKYGLEKIQHGNDNEIDKISKKIMSKQEGFLANCNSIEKPSLKYINATYVSPSWGRSEEYLKVPGITKDMLPELSKSEDKIKYMNENNKEGYTYLREYISGNSSDGSEIYEIRTIKGFDPKKHKLSTHKVEYGMGGLRDDDWTRVPGITLEMQKSINNKKPEERQDVLNSFQNGYSYHIEHGKSNSESFTTTFNVITLRNHETAIDEENQTILNGLTKDEQKKIKKYLKNEKFSQRQKELIAKGIQYGYDVSLYANPKYRYREMEDIYYDLRREERRQNRLNT